MGMMSERALVIIDVQNSIFGLPLPLYDSDRFLRNQIEVLRKVRALGMHVVFIQNTGPVGGMFERGTVGWQIHPALEVGRGELVVEKRHPDAFQETELDACMKDREVSELFVCGFATQACVDSTVRSAYSRGYSTTLLADVHTTTRNEVLEAKLIVDHHNYVLQRFAKVMPYEIAFADRALPTAQFLNT
jgi:nicotinamidase-related amidase